MSDNEPLYQHLAGKTGITIRRSQPVSGGSINQAAKLDTDQGSLFLKWNPQAPADMFDKEVKGLELLREAGAGLSIPKVLSFGGAADGLPGYLLMEYIEQGKSGREAVGQFGAGLARLHACSRPEFGLPYDNYIGRLPQSNRSYPDWTDFFAEERIEPQLRAAVDSGKLPDGCRGHWERLATQLPGIFPDARPSLLHGDLWGGNYHFGPDGRAVLYDPAVYYGHPEMEIAFTRMFGGFAKEFYAAWEEEAGLEPGFDQRVPIYNLYPLLVHVNLFGGHYCHQAVSLLKNYS